MSSPKYVRRVWVHPFVVDAITKALDPPLRWCDPQWADDGVQNILYHDTAYGALPEKP